MGHQLLSMTVLQIKPHKNPKKQGQVSGVSHNRNLGYDEALNGGFKKALELDCKFVITFDADGQHSSKTIEEAVLILTKG